MPQSGPVQLGDYRLLEQLGQGGMAMVYRGERVGEAGFKKTVAIKRMIPQYRRDPSLLERFAAEARTNARLDHPNLVAVVDFGVKPEPYLVMEFVEGVPLATLLHRLAEQGQMMEIAAALFIGAEAAAGLDHAHRKRDEGGNPLGIVHRDVSPQNVLLSNEGAVKVSDFGLVKAADNVVQTGSGIPIGKLSYMAPEQAEHHEVDARADVFSLGVVIWEMLAMRVLIPPNDPVTASQMLKTCAFDPPSAHNPEVTPALDEIVMRCLSRDPSVRTPSAQAVGMSLREVLHELAPGYGRDQLARLLGWAFPERGWQIDEPHETAAQPSLEERMSMPPAQTAAAAMQRSAPAEVPGAKTHVDVAQAEPLVAPAVATTQAPGAVPGPLSTGAQPVLAAPAPRSGSGLAWLLLGGVVLLLAAVAVVIVVAVLMVSVGDEDDSMLPPPPSTRDVPVAPGAAGQTTRIDANVRAEVFAGADRLGATPVDVSMDGLEGEMIVLLAAGHRPVVLRQIQVMGQQHFLVTLVPDPRPDHAVVVRSERAGTAHMAFGGESLGSIPGVVLVPPTPMGGTAALEIRFDGGGSERVLTGHCGPTSVCEIVLGRGRRGDDRVLEW